MLSGRSNIRYLYNALIPCLHNLFGVNTIFAARQSEYSSHGHCNIFSSNALRQFDQIGKNFFPKAHHFLR